MAFSKVDVHAHFLPDFYLEALYEARKIRRPDSADDLPDWSPEDHLKFMKENRIIKSYLSIPSPGVFLRPPSPTSTALAIELSSRVNSYASSLKSKHPSKFGFFASLPLPDTSAAIAEINRCYKQLNPRPDGFCVLSNIHGAYLGDSAMYPVYEVLDRHSAVIFITPNASHVPSDKQESSSSPESISPSLAVVAPTASQSLPQKISNTQMTPMQDLLFDTTRTVADLLLTRTPMRFPSIRWIVPLAGALLPSTLDRVVSFASVMGQKSSVDLINPSPSFVSLRTADVSSPIREIPTLSASRQQLLHLIHNAIYFDLAGITPLHAQLPALLRWTDPSRLLYGSNVPFTSWESASKMASDFDEECVNFWGGETGAEECAGVRGRNAEDLLG